MDYSAPMSNFTVLLGTKKNYDSVNPFVAFLFACSLFGHRLNHLLQTPPIPVLARILLSGYVFLSLSLFLFPFLFKFLFLFIFQLTICAVFFFCAGGFGGSLCWWVGGLCLWFCVRFCVCVFVFVCFCL